MLRLISAACLLALANSLRCGAPLRVGSPRSTVVAQAQECALIVLKSEDPVAIAKLLKKAWIEGGMKRGIAGAVLIPDEPGAVHIVAEGQNERLASFAKWCSQEIDADVQMTDTEACPTVPLSNKFPLADAENEAAQPWRELLEAANLDVAAAASKRHSSDEGLA